MPLSSRQKNEFAGCGKITKYTYCTVYVPSSQLGLPQPLPRKRVCPPTEPKVGPGHTRLRRVRGWRCPNSDDWRKSSALCLLWARETRARICKRSPGIEFEESIPPGCESIPGLFKKVLQIRSQNSVSLKPLKRTRSNVVFTMKFFVF